MIQATLTLDGTDIKVLIHAFLPDAELVGEVNVVFSDFYELSPKWNQIQSLALYNADGTPRFTLGHNE